MRRMMTVLLLSAAFVVSLAGSAVAVDAHEPDNAPWMASGPLVSGETTTSYLSYGAGPNDRDADWYYFFVNTRADATCTLAVQGDLGLGIYDLTLYRFGDGDVEGIEKNSTRTRTQIARQLGSGLYYLRVDSALASFSPSVSYAVSVEGTGVSLAPTKAPAQPVTRGMPEMFERDRSNAQTLSPNVYSVGHVGTRGDVDWYRFDVTRATTATVALLCTSPSLHRATLYRETSATPLVIGAVTTSATTSWHTNIVQPLQIGHYLISVEAPDSLSQHDYTISCFGHGSDFAPIGLRVNRPAGARAVVKLTRRGGKAVFSAGCMVTDSSGAPMADRAVVLQRLSGGVWRDHARMTTGADGLATARIFLTRAGTTQWRWACPADWRTLKATGPTTSVVVR